MVIGIDASRANRDFKTGTEWYSYYLIKNLIEIDKENRYILYTDKPLSESFLNDLNLEKNKQEDIEHQKSLVKHSKKSLINVGIASGIGLGAGTLFAVAGHKSNAIQKISY